MTSDVITGCLGTYRGHEGLARPLIKVKPLEAGWLKRGKMELGWPNMTEEEMEQRRGKVVAERKDGEAGEGRHRKRQEELRYGKGDR